MEILKRFYQRIQTTDRDYYRRVAWQFDPKGRPPKVKYHGGFWYNVGGAIPYAAIGYILGFSITNYLIWAKIFWPYFFRPMFLGY